MQSARNRSGEEQNEDADIVHDAATSAERQAFGALPSNKNSLVWRGFEVALNYDDKGQAFCSDYSQARCMLCKKWISWGGPRAKAASSTSPLSGHITSVHAASGLAVALMVQAGTMSITGDTRQSTLEQWAKHPYGLGTPPQVERERALLVHLACDNQPLSRLESPWFREFIAILDKRFILPHVDAFEDRVLPSLFKSVQDKVCSAAAFFFPCS